MAYCHVVRDSLVMLLTSLSSTRRPGERYVLKRRGLAGYTPFKLEHLHAALLEEFHVTSESFSVMLYKSSPILSPSF